MPRRNHNAKSGWSIELFSLIRVVPRAFRSEPFASLSRGPDLLQHEVLTVLSISSIEFVALRREGYLRPITCTCAPLYNRKKVVAFAYGLTANRKFADVIGAVIGRRGILWANGEQP